VTKYFYDSLGHMTKVGAGSSGTTDPTEYFYSSTTGLLTKVRYTSGSNTYDADYEYDGIARLTKITDWIDDTNWNGYVDGLRYGYDAAGQLTRITDYDDSYLTYEYDDAGLVTSMTDYHGNETTYTAANRLSTLTAPGSRVWDYDYNAIGQATPEIGDSHLFLNIPAPLPERFHPCRGHVTMSPSNLPVVRSQF